MKDIVEQKSGVDRSHRTAKPQKTVFALFHAFNLACCGWMIFFDGWSAVGNLFDKQWTLADPYRAYLLFACVVLYFSRHMLTLFYLLKRNLVWSEVFGLVVFFALFEIGLVLVGGGAFRDNAVALSWRDILAVLLVLTGSFLNSYSELQRHWWKQKPTSRSHCYTEGLFSYSMHINYFGDTILFSGWCLATVNLWTFILPLFMAAMFIFYHIPGLDAYLKTRYGNEYKSYAAATKRFIPFVY